MVKLFGIFFITFLLSIAAWSFRPFILHSGQSRVPFVEFYTPQDCPTCAAPQDWLTALKGHGLWKKEVPITILMDGPLSKAEFTPKGQKLTTLPGFFLNGEEWQWNTDSKVPDEKETAGELDVARAKLEEFEITFKTKKSLTDPQVTAALLGNGMPQNFVVLESASKSLRKSGDSWTTHIKLSMKKNESAKSYSAAFWVEDGGKILQATGGDLSLN